MELRAPRDLAHHHANEVGLVAPGTEEHLRDRPELVERRLVRRLDARERLEQLAPVLAKDGLQHLFLRLEVVIQQPVRDPRLLGDISDAARVVALGREDTDGRIEDHAALVRGGVAVG